MIRIGLGLAAGNTGVVDCTSPDHGHGNAHNGRGQGLSMSDLGIFHITQVSEVEYEEDFVSSGSMKKSEDFEFDRTASQSSVDVVAHKNNDRT